MAQKDYVGRGRSTGTRRKKNSSRSKKRNGSSGVSKIMVGLAAAVLVAFVGGLWFIAHHKKEETPVFPDRKVSGNGLPPKPEERWKYIKELENRQISVPTPKAPSASGEMPSQTQLTDEQRQLLEQMQADMRHAPTQLNEVPWNEQTPVQQQQQRAQQQLQQQHVRQHSNPSAQTQHMLPQNAPRAPQNNQTRQQETAKTKAAEKEQSQRWMIQCGSFKGSSQAESVRAQLAFDGFESRIISSGGWNRVVIGPYNNRARADNTLKRLHGSGYSSCIPLALGG